eukprot:CAMPEP_0114250934 /NCGR_PEP_ID=MMETSP0058-20121206/14978_1 /TAXON_ID=36894 /ORGANISM="Pyramimonas parkeae, CCMP726" /LENGTH=281 /DNA_ID=CAMNT_0001364655 /DNA_START=125 /DNA_END=970 /DNA_ORIENTATION=-
MLALSFFVTTEGGKTVDAGQTASGKGLYPTCPDHPLAGSTKNHTLKEWIIAGLKAAPISDFPFKRSLFWCDVFPPVTYAALDTYWPPTALMHQDVKSGRSKKVSHKNAGERFKTSLEDLLQADKNQKVVKGWAKAKGLWKMLSEVLFSKEFEAVLWQKMDIKKKWAFRDFRIQTDAKGFAIGAHPDISKKIATMMFYLPSGDVEQRKKQASEYGTCLHTKAQFDARSKVDGATQCASKFMFLANAGYTFTVSRNSYHSASAGNYGPRRTIMLNWYNTVWKN